MEIALEKGLSEISIRDIIHQARTSGFLSTTSQGRVGGQLTPKALEVLKRRG
jgi:hypothetical protein